MTTPQPKEGQMQAAKTNIAICFKLLEESLGSFGAQTEEGKAVLSALSTLTKKFGEDRAKSEQLIPAELMQMNSASGAAPGPAAQAMPAGKPAIPQGAPA
jgi:hypothetical protein